MTYSNFSEHEKAVLKYLSDKYTDEHNSGMHSLNLILSKNQIVTQNVFELGQRLKAKGVIKESGYVAGNDYFAEINLLGIAIVNDMWFSMKLDDLVRNFVGSSNEFTSMNEILGINNGVIQRDLAEYLQKTGLFEFLYQDNVYVKLTSEGVQKLRESEAVWLP